MTVTVTETARIVGRGSPRSDRCPLQLPEPGAVLAGEYRVDRLLARGGMAFVYVVDQISTGRQRALKVMHPELAGHTHARARFEQEALIAGLIESGHVVEVHAVGVDPATDLPWLVMDLLVGETLEERMRRGPLDIGELRLAYRQICHAMEAAHRAGVVHCDLKPQNLFVSRDPGREQVDVKVLDFGISKLGASVLGSPRPTGTPMWMAPEQAFPETVSAAADIWALGLMAFYLLTRRSFWRSAGRQGGPLTSVLREVLIDSIPSASMRAGEYGERARLPAGFDAWFARCVTRSPADRYASVSAMWRDLDALLAAAEERQRWRARVVAVDTVRPPPPRIAPLTLRAAAQR
jgi:eukaryotic-like serine/threonine-protein kinase